MEISLENLYVDLGAQRVKSPPRSFYPNRIIDGSNLTMSDEHMWLIPFTDGQDHLLTVDLGQPTPLIGLRVWNYNKSIDDTFRGVRNVLEIRASKNLVKFERVDRTMLGMGWVGGEVK